MALQMIAFDPVWRLCPRTYGAPSPGQCCMGARPPSDGAAVLTADSGLIPTPSRRAAACVSPVMLG